MSVKFGVTFEGAGRVKTLCLIALSDAWRRGAEFDNPSLATSFNKYAKKLCAAAQFFDFDDPDHYPREKWPREKAKEAFENIVKLAKEENIERIILPVYKKSPIGKWVARRVIEKHDQAELDVALQEHPYMSRFHHIGNIDERHKTALTFGMAYVVD